MRYCEPCRAKADQDAQDALENALNVRRLDGTVERLTLPRAFLNDRRVISFSAGELRYERASCGEVIHAVLGVIRAARELMSVHDAARHATFLGDLLDFRPEVRGRAVRVRTAPAGYLEIAVWQWLESFFQQDVEPFHLSYAINTAELVDLVALGGFVWSASGGDGVEVEGLLNNRDGRRHIDILRSSSFRKEVTERSLGGLCVLARVPPGCRLCRTSDKATLVEAGEEFGLRIVRGHLSENPSLEDVDLRVEHLESRAPTFDLSPPFEFRCELLTSPQGEGFVPWSPGRPYGVRRRADNPLGFEVLRAPKVTVPAFWFSDVIEFALEGADARAFRRRALPRWAADRSD